IQSLALGSSQDDLDRLLHVHFVAAHRNRTVRVDLHREIESTAEDTSLLHRAPPLIGKRHHPVRVVPPCGVASNQVDAHRGSVASRSPLHPCWALGHVPHCVSYAHESLTPYSR